MKGRITFSKSLLKESGMKPTEMFKIMLREYTNDPFAGWYHWEETDTLHIFFWESKY